VGLAMTRITLGHEIIIVCFTRAKPVILDVTFGAIDLVFSAFFFDQVVVFRMTPATLGRTQWLKVYIVRRAPTALVDLTCCDGHVQKQAQKKNHTYPCIAS
jgi:hypothetical protein